MFQASFLAFELRRRWECIIFVRNEWTNGHVNATKNIYRFTLNTDWLRHCIAAYVGICQYTKNANQFNFENLHFSYLYCKNRKRCAYFVLQTFLSDLKERRWFEWCCDRSKLRWNSRSRRDFAVRRMHNFHFISYAMISIVLQMILMIEATHADARIQIIWFD